MFYHVRGDPKASAAFAVPEPHVLIVRAPDDYAGLPQKMRAAFDAVRRLHPTIRLLFKTDDDQRLSPPIFLSKLCSLLLPSTRHYGGFVIDVERAHVSKYYLEHPELPRDLVVQPTRYCSGRFYFLSRAALDALADMPASVFAQEYLEDYAVGRLLPAAFKAPDAILHIPSHTYFTDMPPL